MSSIFPLRDTVTPDEDREPRLVDLDEETADEVFEALSSGTTRTIFLSLHQRPQTASDLAEETNTSVQNIQYHLGKLADADLVEVVDTWYSERGTEMKVYAPKDDSLVLFAGRDKQSTLRSLLNRVTGLLALLVPVSVLAGLGTHWTLDTGSRDDTGVTVGTQGDREGSGDVEPEVGTDGGEDSIGTDAVDGISQESQVVESPDGVVVTQNDTVYVFEDQTAWEMHNATVTETTTQAPDGGSMYLVEGEPAETANEATLLVQGNGTDLGSNVTLPTGLVDGSGDTAATIAGLDPAVAVGVSVLLGGILVAAGFAAWYGVPGSGD
jgi:DNA-binding transcriptional ArsR family regulator